MAFTFDTKLRNPVTANTTSSSAVSVSYTCGANAKLLVVGLLYGGSGNRTGGAPTYNSVALTQAGTSHQGTTIPECTVELWYMLNPPVSQALTLAVPNAGGVAMAAHIASANLPSDSVIGLDSVHGVNGATSTNPTDSVTVVNTPTILFAIVGNGATTWNPSSQSGTAIYNDDNGSWGGGSQYLIQSATGSVAMAWTFGTSEDWGIQIAAFYEAPPLNGTLAKTLGDVGIAATATAPYATLAPSSNIASSAATATTAQLTAPAGKSTSDFQAGAISDDTNPIPALDLASGKYTELEWSLQLATGVTGDFEFRVTLNGAPLNTYGVTPLLTVATSGVSGTLTQTLDAATSAGTGTVDVKGTTARTLADATLVAAGTAPLPGANGTLAQTLASATLVSAGTSPISGTTARTLDGVTISASAAVAVVGSLDQGLDDPTLSAAGTVAATSATGALSATLAGVTIQAAGAVAVSGAASIALSNATGQSAGAVAVSGAASVTLAPTTDQGTGTVAVAGSLAASVASVGLSASGSVSIAGVLSRDLEDASVSGSGVVGNVPVLGTLSGTLEDAAIAAGGAVALAGALGVELASVGVSLAGAVWVSAAGDWTLSDVSLGSHGRVTNLAPVDVYDLVTGTSWITRGQTAPASITRRADGSHSITRRISEPMEL